MAPTAQSKVLKKDGTVRKDVRSAFTETAPNPFDAGRVNAPDSKADKVERMENEHVKGLGVVTTNTGLEVQNDMVQFMTEITGLAGEIHRELESIKGRTEKNGRVSSYAYRQLQAKMRNLNAANQRLGIPHQGSTRSRTQTKEVKKAADTGRLLR